MLGKQKVFKDIDNWHDIITNRMSLPVAAAYCKSEIIVLLLTSGVDVNTSISLQMAHIYFTRSERNTPLVMICGL